MTLKSLLNKEIKTMGPILDYENVTMGVGLPSDDSGKGYKSRYSSSKDKKKCPKCGEEQLRTKEETEFRGIIPAGYVMVPQYRTVEKYECEKCGTKFKEDSSDDCFIATAIYRNPCAPQIQTLRKFRDKYLAINPIGESFIKFYYSGAGKKTANIIEKRLPFLIPPMRKGLDFLVDRLDKYHQR